MDGQRRRKEKTWHCGQENHLIVRLTLWELMLKYLWALKKLLATTSQISNLKERVEKCAKTLRWLKKLMMIPKLCCTELKLNLLWVQEKLSDCNMWKNWVTLSLFLLEEILENTLLFLLLLMLLEQMEKFMESSLRRLMINWLKSKQLCIWIQKEISLWC